MQLKKWLLKAFMTWQWCIGGVTLVCFYSSQSLEGMHTHATLDTQKERMPCHSFTHKCVLQILVRIIQIDYSSEYLIISYYLGHCLVFCSFEKVGLNLFIQPRKFSWHSIIGSLYVTSWRKPGWITETTLGRLHLIIIY